MHTIVRSLLLIAVFIPCLITCNRLDPNTTIGQSVIKEYDSTLVDFEKNYYPVYFDTAIIAEARSVPETGNQGFGYHAQQLAVGSEDGFSVYSSVVFYASVTFAERFTTARMFDSITFVFDTLADSLRESDPESIEHLNLYPATRSNRFTRTTPEESVDPAVALATWAETDSSGDTTAIRFTGRLTDEDIQDSIFNRLRQYAQCDSCRSTCDKDSCKEWCDSVYLPGSDSSFYFSLFSDVNAITWLRNIPGMVIHSTDTTADSVAQHADTIWGGDRSYDISYSHCVSVENDSLKEALSSQPVSCYFSGRTAVFSFNTTPLWDSLDNSDFDELLAAGIVLSTDSIFSDSDDSKVTVHYLFTSERISDGKTLFSRLDSVTNNYIRHIDSLTDLSEDTLIIDVSHTLQNYRDKKPARIQLYLQIKSTDVLSTQEVFWKKPRLKAVLTTIR